MKRLSPAMAMAVPAVLVVLSPAGVVRAQTTPRFQPGLYLPVGMNIGAAVHNDLPAGVLVGAEVSLVSWDDIMPRAWFGGYADALWDSGAGVFRGTIGPEFGWLFLGLDTGYVVQTGVHGTHHGLVVRPMITLGFFAIQGRFGHLFGDAPGANFLELGVLIKVPIIIDAEPPEPYGGGVSPAPAPPPRSEPKPGGPLRPTRLHSAPSLALPL